jgi:benzoyl-CoA reductase/2-hydroxyglutaryl-CoA dehydratase subunit BcrC/BadD/HgdB
LNLKEAAKLVELTGTKIGKEKLIDALKRSNAKDLAFAKDPSSGYTLVLVKLG